MLKPTNKKLFLAIKSLNKSISISDIALGCVGEDLIKQIIVSNPFLFR